MTPTKSKIMNLANIYHKFRSLKNLENKIFGFESIQFYDKDEEFSMFTKFIFRNSC